MNANIVRNSGQFKPTADTGFYDASLWENAKTQGDAAVKRLINKGLDNTSVTCFLLGAKTSTRPWWIYEFNKSIEDRKGILGILLPNQKEHGPKWVSKAGFAVHTWDHNKFADWVEQGGKNAGR